MTLRKSANMRIVGGKYRHRLINWPGDINVTRPTKDRIREAIFSAFFTICLYLFN